MVVMFRDGSRNSIVPRETFLHWARASAPLIECISCVPEEVPAFAGLEQRAEMSPTARHKALATWDEIDLDAVLWTVPAERMKGRVEHAVPLAPRAVAILREAAPPPIPILLGSRKQKLEHHPAMHYASVPAFVSLLRVWKAGLRRPLPSSSSS